jgi:hypothetical protein
MNNNNSLIIGRNLFISMLIIVWVILKNVVEDLQKIMHRFSSYEQLESKLIDMEYEVARLSSEQGSLLRENLRLREEYESASQFCKTQFENCPLR